MVSMELVMVRMEPAMVSMELVMVRMEPVMLRMELVVVSMKPVMVRMEPVIEWSWSWSEWSQSWSEWSRSWSVRGWMNVLTGFLLCPQHLQLFFILWGGVWLQDHQVRR